MIIAQAQAAHQGGGFPEAGRFLTIADGDGGEQSVTFRF